MALTMTRTRTQTTLTKLAQLVANVHGELAFLKGLADLPDTQSAKAALEVRRMKLVNDREALYATLRQFDAGLDPLQIVSLEGWRKRIGSRSLNSENFEKRYLTEMQKATEVAFFE